MVNGIACIVCPPDFGVGPIQSNPLHLVSRRDDDSAGAALLHLWPPARRWRFDSKFAKSCI
jgi:hypothetical protein